MIEYKIIPVNRDLCIVQKVVDEQVLYSITFNSTFNNQSAHYNANRYIGQQRELDENHPDPIKRI